MKINNAFFVNIFIMWKMMLVQKITFYIYLIKYDERIELL